MSKNMMILLCFAVLCAGVLTGCIWKVDPKRAAQTPTPVTEAGTGKEAYTLDDLIGTWGFCMAVNMEDGSQMTPSEFAAANKIPEDMLTSRGVLTGRLVFDKEGNVTESISGKVTLNGTYTFTPETGRVNMTITDDSDGTFQEVGELAETQISGERTTTIAFTYEEFKTVILFDRLP